MPGQDFVLEPLCLAALDSWAEEASAMVSGLNPGHDDAIAAWSGEGADHTAYRMDDQFWLAQFRSSFYYAWQLSALPLGKVPVGARYPNFLPFSF